jgi:hypothetical protein
LKEIKSIITLVHVHKHLDTAEATRFYANCNIAKLKAGGDSARISKKRKARGEPNKAHTTEKESSIAISDTSYPYKDNSGSIFHRSIIDFVTKQTKRFIGKESLYNSEPEDFMPTIAFQPQDFTSYHIYLWIQYKLAAEENVNML